MEKYLIYIVDDEFVNRMILKEGFQNQYQVKEAADGYELFKLLEEELPDIILLDIMMPGLDGKEVCKKVKSNPRTHDIPIIFISALSDMEDKKEGLELGAVDYIVKPFDLTEVRLRVEQQLKMRELYLKVKKQNQLVKNEMNAARKIQLNLLPFKKDPNFGNYKFCFEYFPCDSLGGDFVDYLKLSENKVLFYLSDVAGHGVSSSLITIFVKQYFYSLVGNDDFKDAKPSKFLKGLNKALMNLEVEGKYLTITLGILDLDTNVLNWSAAGPNTQPILFRDNSFEILPVKGFAIGWFDNIDWDDHSLKLQKNDSLILYSDAAIELFNKDKEMLNIEGFGKILDKLDFKNNKDFDLVVNELLEYSQKIRFDDDLTFLVLDRKE